MSPSLVVTVYSLAFLFSFSVVLFGFIVIRRLVLERRKGRFDRLYGHIEKDVLEAISLLNSDFSLEVARKHRNHLNVLTQVLLDFGNNIVGEGREQLRLIFNHAVKHRCLKRLASRWTARRLQSIRLFIIFFDPADSNFLFRLLNDKPIIKLAAVNALSRIPSLETLNYIFKAFEEDTGFTVQAYFNIMFSLGDRTEPLVKAFLKKPLPVDKLGLLVELVGAIPLRTLYGDVVSLAGHPDKEIRIRVARTLGKLLIPETLETLIALASDEAWEVRAQAVKSLGKMRNLKALDILANSLFSPYWYVRHNAGYGLAEMGEEGLCRLKEIAGQKEDRYARDMSVMVLNELIILSLVGIFRHRNLTRFVSFKEVFRLPLVKPISIIAPAYNEDKTIIESIRALLSLEYPVFEVIVVNDGSSDRTLDVLIQSFRLEKSRRVFRKVLSHKPVKGIYTSPSHPNLIVIDKANGRKADALNAGLNVSRYPLFCAVDGDSLLEKDALLKMVRPFLEDPERTMAAGGIIRLINGCLVKGGQVQEVRLPGNALARFQVIEYFRAFLGGRIGMSMLKSILIISGAFGLFRKDVALQCGGYRTGTIGEDMDLIVRIRRHLHNMKRPFEICFIPDPICWTEAPETLKSLSRQRNRWHRGLLDTLRHNKAMLFNPRYGITGLFAMPFYFIFETLGPFIELLGYVIFVACIALGFLDYWFALLFFLFAVVLGTLLSLLSILLEEYSSGRYPRLQDILILTLFSLLENILYRQWLTFVRVSAFFDFYKGKEEWGAMHKKGFVQAG